MKTICRKKCPARNAVEWIIEEGPTWNPRKARRCRKTVAVYTEKEAIRTAEVAQERWSVWPTRIRNCRTGEVRRVKTKVVHEWRTERAKRPAPEYLPRPKHVPRPRPRRWAIVEHPNGSSASPSTWSAGQDYVSARRAVRGVAKRTLMSPGVYGLKDLTTGKIWSADEIESFCTIGGLDFANPKHREALQDVGVH